MLYDSRQQLSRAGWKGLDSDFSHCCLRHPWKVGMPSGPLAGHVCADMFCPSMVPSVPSVACRHILHTYESIGKSISSIMKHIISWHLYDLCAGIHHILSIQHKYIYSTYIRTYMHACMHACIHTYIHACLHACMQAYIHTYVYIYIHRYTFLKYVCNCYVELLMCFM